MRTHIAKVFMSGRSQAVRLPNEFRFETDEVYITKQGDSLILTAKEPSWDDFFDSEPVFDDNFLSDRGDAPSQRRDYEYQNRSD